MALSIIVDEEGDGERIDRYLAGCIPALSRSRIQALLRAGLVSLEGSRPRASRRVSSGECIEIEVPEPEEALPPERGSLVVLHEDEDILVIDKPPGLTVHPVREGERGTLANLLRGHVAKLSTLGGMLRPGIVHRLDRDTSGLMMVAKTDRAYASLVGQMKKRTVEKEYHALLLGRLEPPEGTVTVPVGRDPFHRQRMAVRMTGGKAAQTAYGVAEALGRFSWVHLKPRTGRTHQIRVHMAYLGHPVAGDHVYGPSVRALERGRFSGWNAVCGAPAREVTSLIRRQALHASGLVFTHPVTGEICEFRAPLPDDMSKLLAAVRGECYG